MFSKMADFGESTTFDSLKKSIKLPSIEYIQDKVDSMIKVKEEVDKYDLLDYDYIKHKIDNEYNINIDEMTKNVHLDEIKDKVDIEKIKNYGKQKRLMNE